MEEIQMIQESGPQLRRVKQNLEKGKSSGSILLVE